MGNVSITMTDEEVQERGKRIQDLQDKYKTIGREDILKEATGIVMGDRADTYGEPEDNFKLIAEFWNSYINSKNRIRAKLDGEDVAIMMGMLKIARISTGEYKADNYIDLVGYGACAGELSSRKKKRIVGD